MGNLRTVSVTGHFYNLEIKKKKNRMGGGNTLNSIREMNTNELPKAERHAKQRGMDLDTYLEKKHGKKAAEFARQRDLAEYLLERQIARGWKTEKLKKKWHDLFTSSSSSSSDSDNVINVVKRAPVRQTPRGWKTEKLKKKWHDIFSSSSSSSSDSDNVINVVRRAPVRQTPMARGLFSSSSDSEYCNWN